MLKYKTDALYLKEPFIFDLMLGTQNIQRRIYLSFTFFFCLFNLFGQMTHPIWRQWDKRLIHAVVALDLQQPKVVEHFFPHQKYWVWRHVSKDRPRRK